jgi:hypothetical protein
MASSNSNVMRISNMAVAEALVVAVAAMLLSHAILM